MSGGEISRFGGQIPPGVFTPPQIRTIRTPQRNEVDSVDSLDGALFSQLLANPNRPTSGVSIAQAIMRAAGESEGVNSLGEA